MIFYLFFYLYKFLSFIFFQKHIQNYPLLKTYYILNVQKNIDSKIFHHVQIGEISVLKFLLSLPIDSANNDNIITVDPNSPLTSLFNIILTIINIGKHENIPCIIF